jgi:Mg/Co/Ni transporter MgtE
MPIPITKAVFEGLEAVRLSGATNMLDRPRVVELLDSMGYDDAAEWVRNHKSEYSHGVFQGFQVTEEAAAEKGGEA